MIGKAGRVGTGVLVAAALALSLTACRSDHVASGNAPAVRAPVVGSATAAPPAAPAAVSGAATTTAPAAAGAPAATPAPTDASAALSRITSDLGGIDAGSSQASQDAGAGDAARSTPDGP